MKIVIDGTNAILGRLASYVAKRALSGDEVFIVNAEKVVITGNERNIFEEWKQKIDRGNPYKGPFYPKRPDLLVKRVIRGMLPWKKHKGRTAFKRIKVFIGVPEELKNEKIERLPEKYTVDKLKVRKYVILGDLCKKLGAKW